VCDEPQPLRASRIAFNSPQISCVEQVGNVGGQHLLDEESQPLFGSQDVGAQLPPVLQQGDPLGLHGFVFGAQAVTHDADNRIRLSNDSTADDGKRPARDCRSRRLQRGLGKRRDKYRVIAKALQWY
jgi:hypothetical protein